MKNKNSVFIKTLQSSWSLSICVWIKLTILLMMLMLLVGVKNLIKILVITAITIIVIIIIIIIIIMIIIMKTLEAIKIMSPLITITNSKETVFIFGDIAY